MLMDTGSRRDRLESDSPGSHFSGVYHISSRGVPSLLFDDHHDVPHLNHGAVHPLLNHDHIPPCLKSSDSVPNSAGSSLFCLNEDTANDVVTKTQSGSNHQSDVESFNDKSQKDQKLLETDCPVHVTLTKSDSNISQKLLSTFGKKQVATKKDFLKLQDSNLLSPTTFLTDNHCHSAGFLGPQSQKDLNGELYIDVDHYKTIFGVEDVSPPIGEWEKETMKKNRSASSDYNEETLEALRKVTRKFDSFRMRMLRVKSFQQPTLGDKDDSKKSEKNKNINKIEEEEEERAILEVLRTNKCNDFNRVSYTASQLIKRSSQITSDSIPGNEISEKEVEKIKFFYSSIDCEVTVADCLVDMLVSVKNTTACDTLNNQYRWVQVWVGVPVMVFNHGAHPRKPRQLIIALAERETGMPLWKERVTYTTEYKQIDDGVSHFINESSQEKRALKMRWSNKAKANEFFEKFKSITADQNDPLWRARHDEKTKQISNSSKPPKNPFKSPKPKKNNEIKTTKYTHKKLSSHKSFSYMDKLKKRHSYKKDDISEPCHLKEITKIQLKDEKFRVTFAGLLPVPKNEGSRSNGFRPRLPTN